MKKTALFLTIIGILLLILLSFFYTKPLLTSKQIENLLPNQKILISGKVIQEKNNPSYHTLIINNISIRCMNPCPSYLNSKVQVFAVTKEYKSKYLQALQIKKVK